MPTHARSTRHSPRLKIASRLCDALGITRRHNRMDLLGDDLFLVDAPRVPASRVARGPRIGVDYAGEWAGKPYRLWLRDHPHVSRTPTRPSPTSRRIAARGA